MKKLEYGSWSKLDGIKFESDLDHHPDTKKNFVFSNLLIITCLGRGLHAPSALI